MPRWDAERFAKVVFEKYSSINAFARALNTSSQGVRAWFPPNGPGPEKREQLERELGIDINEFYVSSPPGVAGREADFIQEKLDAILRTAEAARDRVYFRNLADEMPGVMVGQLPDGPSGPRYALIDDDGWVVANVDFIEGAREAQRVASARVSTRMRDLAARGARAEVLSAIEDAAPPHDEAAEAS